MARAIISQALEQPILFLALFLFDGLARGAPKQMFVSKSQVSIELI
jgi:hypothetical protein